MDFETFKENYRKKLEFETALSPISDEELAKMFIALVVVEEYRNKEMKRQAHEMREKSIKSVEGELLSRLGLDRGGDPS